MRLRLSPGHEAVTLAGQPQISEMNGWSLVIFVAAGLCGAASACFSAKASAALCRALRSCGTHEDGGAGPRGLGVYTDGRAHLRWRARPSRDSADIAMASATSHERERASISPFICEVMICQPAGKPLPHACPSCGPPTLFRNLAMAACMLRRPQAVRELVGAVVGGLDVV